MVLGVPILKHFRVCKNRSFWCIGMLLCLFVSFTKGIVLLLFASQKDKTLPKRGLLLKERICSWRSEFFSLRVVAVLFYVHGKHLRSCRDGQLT